jgi:D-alanyl-D-alanine carboxypeptidase
MEKSNLLYLSLLSFVLISTSAISISSQTDYFKIDTQKVLKEVNAKFLGKKYSDLPVLKDGATFPIISAQSAVAIDLVSGVSLYEKDPNKKLLPASTTKIMTALVALDTYDLDQILKVGKINVVGQKMGLVWGEEIKFIDLLKGLLIFSANDAAEVLALNHPAGRDVFIGLMNKKAQDLGLKDTHFENPTGLDGNGGQYSTTRDLVILSKQAIKNPFFKEIVAIKNETVKSVDGKYIHRLININKLLGEVDGVYGVKTGWTENARENLVSYLERDNRKIMIAVLGSSDRFGETKELIKWIFDNYSWEEVKIPN